MTKRRVSICIIVYTGTPHNTKTLIRPISVRSRLQKQWSFFVVFFSSFIAIIFLRVYAKRCICSTHWQNSRLYWWMSIFHLYVLVWCAHPCLCNNWFQAPTAAPYYTPKCYFARSQPLCVFDSLFFFGLAVYVIRICNGVHSAVFDEINDRKRDEDTHQRQLNASAWFCLWRRKIQKPKSHDMDSYNGKCPNRTSVELTSIESENKWTGGSRLLKFKLMHFQTVLQLYFRCISHSDLIDKEQVSSNIQRSLSANHNFIPAEDCFHLIISNLTIIEKKKLLLRCR